MAETMLSAARTGARGSLLSGYRREEPEMDNNRGRNRDRDHDMGPNHRVTTGISGGMILQNASDWRLV